MSTSALTIMRKLGLAHSLDKIRFRVMQWRNAKTNKAFIENHPDISLPPDYLMYESFQLNYDKYYHGGKETAQWLVDHMSKWVNLSEGHVLDWGCGPGRVVRHLPELLGPSAKIYGTDYNPKSIAWCKRNIPNVSFHLNSLYPPLPFQSKQMHAVYGISLFTHLSYNNHIAWLEELARITIAGTSSLLITTQGKSFRSKLNLAERNTFDSGQIVIRQHGPEGHRVYAAFHPPAGWRDLVQQAGFNILDHIPGQVFHDRRVEQDVWLLRR